MKANYYKVSYTKANNENDTLIVKARNEIEALKNAKNVCYTGSNFQNPVQTEEQTSFAEQTSGHHSNRINK